MMNDIFRTCRKCDEEHSVFYEIQKNNTYHLKMYCENNKTYIYLPKEHDLPIPIKESKNKKLSGKLCPLFVNQ